MYTRLIDNNESQTATKCLCCEIRTVWPSKSTQVTRDKKSTVNLEAPSFQHLVHENQNFLFWPSTFVKLPVHQIHCMCHIMALPCQTWIQGNGNHVPPKLWMCAPQAAPRTRMNPNEHRCIPFCCLDLDPLTLESLSIYSFVDKTHAPFCRTFIRLWL